MPNRPHSYIDHPTAKPLLQLDLDVLSKGLTTQQLQRLQDRFNDPLIPEKSGLSIDHVIGCPLGCGYCVRHNFGAFDISQPYLIESDEAVVSRLMSYKYFVPHVTPLKIFTQATDAMVPAVKPHLFNTLQLLDDKGLTNHMLVITRFKVEKEDCDRLNSFRNLKITLLITYSGIEDPKVEPIDSSIAVRSLQTSYARAVGYKVVAYWRPIIVGLNDSDRHIDFVLQDLGKHAHAIVFTGLRQTAEIKAFFQKHGVPDFYDGVIDRRKIFPDNLEERILSRLPGTPSDGKLFRKTSCGVSAVHNLPDYNGHFVIGEKICNICNEAQQKRCKGAHRPITQMEVAEVAKKIGLHDLEINTDGKGGIVSIPSLTNTERYYIRHALGHAVLDPQYPHAEGQYGRADKLRDFGSSGAQFTTKVSES